MSAVDPDSDILTNFLYFPMMYAAYATLCLLNTSLYSSYTIYNVLRYTMHTVHRYTMPTVYRYTMCTVQCTLMLHVCRFNKVNRDFNLSK